MSIPVRHAQSPIGARMNINGREVDYYCGTSYYTLHGNPQVIAAASEAMQQFGIAPATSLAMTPYEELEDLAKSFFDAGSVSYIASGYLGMMVLAQALRDDYDIILVDELSHYSIVDAAATMGKKIVPFRHLDPEDLTEKLRAHVQPGQTPLVATDGVFPVTGAIAPLLDYTSVLERYQEAVLCVDDSHAVGVIGEKGRGTFEYCGMTSAVKHYFSGTLSKAFGGFGGIVVGDGPLEEKIEKNVRVPLGASRPPIPAAAASSMGIKLLRDHPEMRQRLWRNVKQVRDGLRNLGFDIPDTPIPIVNLKGASSLDLEHVQEELYSKDIVVAHIPPRGYSDAPDVASLRIAVFSTHSSQQIERLLATIKSAI